MYNTYKNITTPATTTFVGQTNQVILASININKALTGTLVIKSGSTTIGTIAAGTAVGQYWYTNHGITIPDFTIVNASSEDVTVFYRNL